MHVERRLRERSLGHWEGLTRDEVAVKYPDEYADWIAGRDVSRRGGESREQVAERALAAFDALPEVETVVLVTHSATAMALCTALLGLDQQRHVLGPLANCHWSELVTRSLGAVAAARAQPRRSRCRRPDAGARRSRRRGLATPIASRDLPE